MKKRQVYQTLFWLYCAMMAFLLLGRSRFVVEDGYWNTISRHLSLQPLHTIRLFIDILVQNHGGGAQRTAIVNLAGNVVLFLPLGFLPPLLWKGFRKLFKCLLWCGLIIVCVELCQLFALVGNCDIDDLLLNLVGVGMGYGLYRLCVFVEERRA